VDELTRRIALLLREHAFSAASAALGLALLFAAAHRLAAPVGLPQSDANVGAVIIAGAPPLRAAPPLRTPHPTTRSAIAQAVPRRPHHNARRAAPLRIAANQLHPHQALIPAAEPPLPRHVPVPRHLPERHLPPVLALPAPQPPAVKRRSAPLQPPAYRHMVPRNLKRPSVAANLASRRPASRSAPSTLSNWVRTHSRSATMHRRLIALVSRPRPDAVRRSHPERRVGTFEPPMNYDAHPLLLTASAAPLQATSALTVTLRSSRRRH